MIFFFLVFVGALRIYRRKFSGMKFGFNILMSSLCALIQRFR